MRVLISTRSGAGHFGPLIPFAHALLRDNAEVLVTAPTSLSAMVAEAGLDHHPIPDPPQDGRQEVFAKALTLDHDEANELIVSELFVRKDTPADYPHLKRAIEAWEPDVLLYDISHFAAGLAAEATGVPAVSVAITAGTHMRSLAPTLAETLDEVRAQIGLDPDPELARLDETPTFTLMPKALELPEPVESREPVRFRVPEPLEPRPLPDWWSNDEWPLVYLTFGSVAPTTPFFPEVYRGAMDELSALPVRVLLTIGRERDPAELGEIPSNVHVARWVPQADVMPHASAMVCHGGSGTIHAGLAAGVPMAVVPLFADQPHNARRVEAIGAGLALDGVEGLGDAVRSLLADDSYRTTAARIAEELGQLPTVDTATALLRDLAAARAA